MVFSRNLLGLVSGFMMLGLCDIAIPAMLLALVLCFDYPKTRDVVKIFDLKIFKGSQIQMIYALPGYTIGLVSALAAGVLSLLTHSP
ncbi:hypothetical protein Bca4012_007739 [Brassica carinata]|uniref:(rape) hypothetical protein n=1 Tax=Brassica napus TaxID=3708 RepID=A0A078GSW1_BRANA|nr:unnamed protein product [Brassica napus]CDY28299.1 BnaC03g66600D [Brassica napus]